MEYVYDSEYLKFIVKTSDTSFSYPGFLKNF